MPAPRKPRLADAVQPPPAAARTRKNRGETAETAAEQTREAQESARARASGGSIRGRMVDIGRGNQQAGRQKGS